MEPIEIREAGLLLRPWRRGDLDAVHRACQDAEIQRWTSVPSPYRREDAERFVSSHTPQSWRDETGAHFGIFDPGTDELLGSCALGSLRRPEREARIGYWVAPWARGHSVAARAARAVARWGLDSLGLDRIAWQAAVGNHPSLWVAEQIGVRLEGTLRAARCVRGRRVDSWLGGLLRGELREPDPPLPATLRRRRRTFSGAQPTIVSATPAGARVTLRPLRRTDVATIVAACRDAEAVRWTTVPDPYGLADAVAFVEDYAPGMWARGDGATFAITDADDAYVGSMSVRHTGPDTADVGFLTAPAARGRGYASTALEAVTDWAFRDLGLHRIEWSAYVGNDASRRVAERAGFRVEGVSRAALMQRGVYRDAWTGARLSTDPAPDMPAPSGPQSISEGETR